MVVGVQPGWCAVLSLNGLCVGSDLDEGRGMGIGCLGHGGRYCIDTFTTRL
jgi:hypothetical protein